MKKYIITLLLLAISIPAFSDSGNPDPVEMKKNIEELTEYFEGKGYAFSQLLKDPRFKLVEDITGKFTRAAEVRIEDFEDYKKVINFDRKKGMIAEFMRTHASELIKAEKEYGIPKNVIAGIIGIESEFGEYSGSYNPFNAYVSMYAEGYRAKFAKAQLEELLIFVKEHELDVFELKSSYAGAMSYAQFIPYSLNRWFVGNDLYNMNNNIKSVANYLAHFKEITGSVEKAIFRYNPSTMYTKVVLALAEEGILLVD
jgi:membrane-bound lytic murein transglycosylase B